LIFVCLCSLADVHGDEEEEGVMNIPIETLELNSPDSITASGEIEQSLIETVDHPTGGYDSNEESESEGEDADEAADGEREHLHESESSEMEVLRDALGFEVLCDPPLSRAPPVSTTRQTMNITRTASLATIT